MKTIINTNGFYGTYGGAFIPEMLHKNIADLKKAFYEIKDDMTFHAQFKKLLSDYVGRPSPLYFAASLSEKYKTKIYLKREDLNHTGSHKINNNPNTHTHRRPQKRLTALHRERPDKTMPQILHI